MATVRTHVEPVSERSELLLNWAAHHGRDLPWRNTRDPWAILVSEVMAQQTQVARVIPKWHAFLGQWPTPQACADASLGDVLRMWQGLGYPRRAKNLHACAAALSELESFPSELPDLLALPGIGEYTARAILAFAFEADVAVVDTNTARVLARWGNRQLNRREVQEAADAEVPSGEGWAWNQAMLDLGAMVCTLRQPSCVSCPVNHLCAYQGSGADPAVGTAGVSVRQAPFAGSDRQVRGKLLRAANTGVPRAQIAEAVKMGSDPERVARLVDALIGEGLLVETDGRLSLPD